MKVVFCIPPPEQRIGGLDSAITALRTAIADQGIEVIDALPAQPNRDTLVHFHGLWRLAHARLARQCTAQNIPYLVSPHGMLEPWAWRHKWWKKWPYFHLIEKRFLAQAQALLATATSEAERLRTFAPRQRIETLPLGLTSPARPDYEKARAQLGWKPEERILLFLSRIHVKKGLNFLLEALCDFPAPEPVRLVIVGDGEPSYVQSLQDFAQKNAAKLPRVEWIGAVWGDARWPYFQGADLFCLPTHSENFGLAVLEACQVGTPALTTVETPWATELTEGRGFIGQPTTSSTRRQLTEYLAHPRWNAEQRQALADWAHDRFAWATLAPRYASLYHQLLKPETGNQSSS